jgi:hypothetical protein
VSAAILFGGLTPEPRAAPKYNKKAVSVLPIPAPLQQLGQRPFSFYPPIVNIEHNEWLLRSATSNDVQVSNTKTGEEISVPRHYLGELSSIDEPVILVGLIKELEYRQGVLLPHIRRVIEMPRAVNDAVRTPFRWSSDQSEAPRPAPVVAIRLESGPQSRARRFVRGSVAAGVLTCLTAVVLMRDGALGWNTGFTSVRQINLPFTALDDYSSIVSKFGLPGSDHWKAARGSTYRGLWYPQQSILLILGGSGGAQVRYLGALDRNGRVVHSVSLPDGQSSRPVLRKMKVF